LPSISPSPSVSPTPSPSASPTPTPTPQCSDNQDNDRDGATDHPADFSCSSPDDDDETNPKAQCQDGIDNDGDGKIDYGSGTSNDPDCASRQDNDESGPPSPPVGLTGGSEWGTDGSPYVTLRWTDTSENETGFSIERRIAGAVQWNEIGTPPADSVAFHDSAVSPNTTYVYRIRAVNKNGYSSYSNEATVKIPPLPQCRDGQDNDNDGAADHPADFSCSSPDDDDETNPKAQCQDGIDNDGDGKIDYGSDAVNDPECESFQDNSEDGPQTSIGPTPTPSPTPSPSPSPSPTPSLSPSPSPSPTPTPTTSPPPGAWNPPYPRTFTLNWGGSHPWWLAEHDLVVQEWKFLEDVRRAKEINLNLKAIGTNAWEACGDNRLMQECPDGWVTMTNRPYEDRITDCDNGYGVMPACMRYELDKNGKIACDSNGKPICVWPVSDLSDYSLPYTDDSGSPYYGLTQREAYIAQIAAQDLSVWDGGGADWFWMYPYWSEWWPYLDLDRNGVDDDIEHGEQWKEDTWKDGHRDIMTDTRNLLGPDKLFYINNGSMNTYDGFGPSILNGQYCEKIGSFCDISKNNNIFFDTYRDYMENGREPHTIMINNFSMLGDFGFSGPPKLNYRKMRYGLGIALWGDAFYNFEDTGGESGGNEHFWDRWYDEFDVPLGYPTCDPQEVGAPGSRVFFRPFDNGAMIFNANDYDVTVTDNDLRTRIPDTSCYRGPYYRFKGNQNPSYNDGSLFTSITLEGDLIAEWGKIGGDAIILVKQENQPVVAKIIVDTEEFSTLPSSDKATLTGSWNGVCDDGGFATGYRWCSGVNPYYRERYTAQNSDASATFSPTVNVSGRYRISEFHAAVSGQTLASNAPWELTVNGTPIGSGTINQRIGAERWNALGTFTLPAGADIRFIIRSDNSVDGAVVADAIMFEYVGE
jgi:hypothetical protein